MNTIRHMLIEKGIHHDWSNVVRIMSSQIIQTIEVPKDKKKIYISKPARPTREVLEILQATNCKSIIPERKKYVVYH